MKPLLMLLTVAGLFGGGLFLGISMHDGDNQIAAALIGFTLMVIGAFAVSVQHAAMRCVPPMFLVLLALCSTANADWTRLGPDRYSDGSYVYRAWYNCGWHYEKLYPYVKAANFWDDALRFEGNLEADQVKRDYIEKRYPAARAVSYGQYAMQTTGYSVLQQGYAPGLVTGGQTLYGLAQFPAAQQLDVNGLLHEAQRLADRTTNLNQVAISGAGQLLSQAIDGNSKAAQILASAQVATAAIQAANPPTQQTTVFRQGPAALPQASPNAEKPAGAPDAPQLPQPAYDQQSLGNRYYEHNGKEVEPSVYGLAALNICAKCHSGPTPKGSLTLTQNALAAMSPDDLASLGEHIAQRINLPVTDKKHMPPQQELPPKWKDGLLSLAGG